MISIQILCAGPKELQAVYFYAYLFFFFFFFFNEKLNIIRPNKK